MNVTSSAASAVESRLTDQRGTLGTIFGVEDVMVAGMVVSTGGGEIGSGWDSIEGKMSVTVDLCIADVNVGSLEPLEIRSEAFAFSKRRQEDENPEWVRLAAL